MTEHDHIIRILGRERTGTDGEREGRVNGVSMKSVLWDWVDPDGKHMLGSLSLSIQPWWAESG